MVIRSGLDNFLIHPNGTMQEALSMIDKNKKGFLVVVYEDETFFGTLTDGDIRRAILKGYALNSRVAHICVRSCKVLKKSDGIGLAIDTFKNESIKFLPVVDDEDKLTNVITKNQLHALLLQDIHADLTHDFSLLDENIVDHEIFQRPWGFYKTTIMNSYCQSKIICVYPHGQLSLQSHDYREEHWIITHGSALAQIDESKIEGRAGSSFFIPKGSKHRLTNIDDQETLVVTEVQLGDYFGEDDIHRYEDVYGRV